ncbi:dihydropteroate synthase [Leucobacter sp. GX24907]
MGVLNVTPDSFSDGGSFDTVERAIERGIELAAQGAHIIDVGGESTRPGAKPVAREEELRRVLPVVRGLADRGLIVSIDTLHAETAQACVAAGARYINDVSGGTHDPAMLAAAAWASAEHGASFIISHWRGIPDPEYQRSDYADLIAEVCGALHRQAEAALGAGVDPTHIMIDPGLGFDKTGAQCWQLLAAMPELRSLGYPVLIGASRKRMLAEVLAELPGDARHRGPEARDLATSVVSALSAEAGAWGVRVHDVPGTVQALAVQDAWRNGDTDWNARRGSVVNGAAVSDTAVNSAVASGAVANGSGDRISLTGLEVFAHHGVFDFEREQGQRFLIDAEVSVDLAAAARGDELARTVHYGELATAIGEAVERDPVDLIETVAERVAQVVLAFDGVSSVTITVHKPDAPIPVTFGDVSVTIVRRRAGDRV